MRRHDPRLPLSVRAAIFHYVMNHSTTCPVSTTSAISAIRASCPDCQLSDDALARAVAMEALELGRSVYFDGNRGQPSTVSIGTAN